jgi:hypothetical protein
MPNDYTTGDPWEDAPDQKLADFTAYNHLQNALYTGKVLVSALLEEKLLRLDQVLTGQELIMRIAAITTGTVHNSWCEHCHRGKHREFPLLSTPLEHLMWVFTNGRMGYCPGCGAGLICLKIHQALYRGISIGTIDISPILLDGTSRKGLLVGVERIARLAATAAGLDYHERECDRCEYGEK